MRQMFLRGNHWRSLGLVIAFEGALGVVAWGVAWILGHDLPLGFGGTSSELRPLAAAGVGILAIGPLGLGLLLIERLQLASLQGLERQVRRLVRRLFCGFGVAELLIVASVAGLGEELLFRGLLQDGLRQWLGGPAGPWLALAIASLAFGVCHWLSTTYAVLACLAGLYFGLLLIGTGNLIAPVVAHAGYDLAALIYLLRSNESDATCV